MNDITSTIEQPTALSKNRLDIHQKVTDTIIRQLEKGVVPWYQPWKENASGILKSQRNALSGRRYRGVNILLLWTAASEHKFTSNEWASFKQWNDKKEAIRKNEKGTMIVYYDLFEKEIEDEIKKVPFLKYSMVFNRCQLASYKPDEKLTENVEAEPLAQRIERIEEFVSNTKAVIETGGDKACYNFVQDKISMPPMDAFIETKTCTATEGYYSTLLHELTHWTGHPARMDRTYGKRFGDEFYAMEELVAELGAAFTCTEFEISRPQLEHSTGYIAHWLKKFQSDKKFIITAASEASKAVQFLDSLII